MAEQPAVDAYAPQAGLSEKERFRRVLFLLEDGAPEEARAELVVYLESQPGSDVASDLLQQMDSPVSDYFPSESRTVELQPGYSLSTLSKIYLGSIYKFHALAKYNGIAEPRKMTAGQKIRIPLTEQAIAAFASETAAADSGPAGEEIDEKVAAPELPAVDMPVESAAEELASEAGVAQGGAAGEAEQPESVAEPQVAPAEQVTTLHRDALNAYRAQDLDKAITLWDQLLEIDPEHENARIYRSQAVELKKKLSSIL